MNYSGQVMVTVKPVTTRRDLRTFVRLPAQIHRHHPQWVPPLALLERIYFNPRKNPSLHTHDTGMALAFRDGRAVGRILTGIHHEYNALRGEKTARFTCLESTNDQDAVNALLGYAEQRARERGMDRIVGPMGLSDSVPEPQGLQVEGFEHIPSLMTNCNYEYLPGLLAGAGYNKEADYVVYRVPIPEVMPDLYERIHQRVVRKGTYRILALSRRSALRQYAPAVLRLMSESFQDLYGYLPREGHVGAGFPAVALNIFDPRFVQLAAYNDEIVGFVLALPNASAGIRRAGGRILPLGFLYILREAKQARQLDLLFGAVKKEHRGRGIDVLMGYRMFTEARAAGFSYMDSHLELESNTRIRREMEAMQGKVYKRYRIFHKTI
jgi:GNAT superfamily N-acetyltransferase